MRMLRAALLIALAIPAAAQTAASSVKPWKWNSAGLEFELTAEDLAVVKGGAAKPVFSFREMLEKQEKQFDADAEEVARELLGEEPREFPDSVMSHAVTMELLSVAGTILSYKYGSAGFSPGAAHPYSFQIIYAVDVAKNNSEVSLLDYFPEKTILQALKADPWILSFELDPVAFQKVETVEALVELLDDAVFSSEADSCDMDADFDVNLLQHFAFYDVTGTKVAVRIAIPYGSEICRGTMHQVGILLPIPANLAESLNKAASREQGFLMKDVKKLGSPSYSGMWETDVEELAERLKKSN